jgi:HK97 family phage portal protein
MTVLATRAGNLSIKSDPLSRGYSRDISAYPGDSYVPLLGRDGAVTLAGLYKTQVWLRAAVNKIASGIARLPLKGYEEQSDSDRLRLRPPDPLASVLRRPRPGMSPFRFKQWLFADLALYGNSISYIDGDSNNIPTGFWPLPWPLTEVRGGAEPQSYIVHAPAGDVVFPADRVFHLRFAESDPNNPMIGMSPVEPLKRTLINEDAAAKWATSIFRNSGRPSGAFVSEKVMNDQQNAALRDQAQTIYGGVDNAGRVAVLSGGLQWQPMSMNVIEAELLKLRQWNREEVAANYDIPPPLLGDLTRATFSNITENHRMFYTGSLPPYLTLFEEEFDAQIITRVPEWADRYVEFDMNEVLKGSPKERAETYAIARRYMTVNEIRQRENLPRIEKPGYDQVWEPTNEVPMGSSQQPALPDATPPKALDPVLLKALERAEQIGKSRLGGKNGKVFSQERFAKELCEDMGATDEATKGWAELVADSVADVLADAETVQDLGNRMNALKESLV